MAALTEFELIDRFFRRPESSADSARGIVLGIGDDAALLAPTPGNQLAASVDMLVSGRHFFADVDPEALGHKALAVNLSDMAAMGASDGLVGDLGHVLEASKVGAVLELASIPRSKALDRQLASSAHDIALQCLLAGGDDYELCFTAAPAHDRRIVALAIELGLELRRVGTIAAEIGLVVQDSSGPLLPLPQAYDHFAA